MSDHYGCYLSDAYMKLAIANDALRNKAVGELKAVTQQLDEARRDLIVAERREQESSNFAVSAHAERDAALSKLAAIVDATLNYPTPRCDEHPPGDTVHCGWKSAYVDVSYALNNTA